MDAFDFVSCISDEFAGLQSNKEIEEKADEMIKIITQLKEMSKRYLKASVL